MLTFHVMPSRTMEMRYCTDPPSSVLAVAYTVDSVMERLTPSMVTLESVTTGSSMAGMASLSTSAENTLSAAPDGSLNS